MYFQRRRGTQVLIYYKTDAGQLKTVPRAHTKHLDSEPDHNVRAWIAQNQGRWEAGGVPRGVVLNDSRLDELVREWVKFREKRGYGTKNIRARAAHALTQSVFPYFLEQTPPLVDPQAWPSLSFRLVEWQERQGVSEANRIHARTALRKFWRWLSDTRVILPGTELPLDMTLRSQKQTTLSYSLTPEQVLTWASNQPDEELRLMGLVGFFGSLRPQEVFALRRCDFHAGTAVATKECCRVMAAVGLFGKFAVDVHRQRRQDGSFSQPKAFSRGLVAVFNEQAAVMIRAILLKHEPDELLFKHKPNWLARRWARGGLPDLVLHDLRKASIYWLGHYGGLDLVPLKNHARHSKVETTMLYCRRPVEAVGTTSNNFDW